MTLPRNSDTESHSPLDRAIAWFARNPVAANLLLAVMVIGGLSTAPYVTLEALSLIHI